MSESNATESTSNMPSVSRSGIRSIPSRVTNWFLRNWFQKILLPVLYTIVKLLFFLALSVITYVVFHGWMVPKALASEPVYFDYNQKPPIAKVNMLALEKQWDYTNDIRISGSNFKQQQKQNDGKHFLRSDFIYQIDSTFDLSKNTNNYNLGKFMVYLAVVDTTGASIARSARPVPIPYQSDTSLWLDALFKYPFRAMGLISQHETARVDVPLMNSYREPSGPAEASSETLELTLNSSEADISNVTVTVMPVLPFLAYYMYYWPVLSAIIGITFCTAFQIGIYMSYLVTSLALQSVGDSASVTVGGMDNATSTYDVEEDDEEVEEVENDEDIEDANYEEEDDGEEVGGDETTDCGQSTTISSPAALTPPSSTGNDTDDTEEERPGAVAETSMYEESEAIYGRRSEQHQESGGELPRIQEGSAEVRADKPDESLQSELRQRYKKIAESLR